MKGATVSSCRERHMPRLECFTITGSMLHVERSPSKRALHFENPLKQVLSIGGQDRCKTRGIGLDSYPYMRKFASNVTEHCLMFLIF